MVAVADRDVVRKPHGNSRVRDIVRKPHGNSRVRDIVRENQRMSMRNLDLEFL